MENSPAASGFVQWLDQAVEVVEVVDLPLTARDHTLVNEMVVDQVNIELEMGSRPEDGTE